MYTIGFIGLGLIGGSIARSIKKKHPEHRIMAYSRTRKKLEIAREDFVIDDIIDEIDERIGQCDIIFLCTPVQFNSQYLSALQPFLGEHTLVTDVGSTKTNIHEEIIALDMEQSFIGGHPMAGSEKTGYEASSDHLLENAYYVLTPTKKTTESQLNMLRTLVEDIGALPLVLDYEKHDHAVAAISHLPHLVAAALVNLVKDSDDESQLMKTIAAGGFKDITRIASSSPEMWQQICTENRFQIADMLKDYIQSLSLILEDVEDARETNIYHLFEESGEYRNSIDDRSTGVIAREYALFIDVADEPGAIATTATILSAQGISIRNIGILHNREFEDGALKITFYEDNACRKAEKVLVDKNYKVTRR